jgi:hypothetical protein
VLQDTIATAGAGKSRACSMVSLADKVDPFPRRGPVGAEEGMGRDEEEGRR